MQGWIEVFIQDARLLLLASPRLKTFHLIDDAQSFDVEIGHTSNVRLRLASQSSNAIRFATVARLSFVSISIDIVVEGQFFALENVSLTEDAHAKVFAYMPLGYVAIGIAGMIDESSNTSLLGRIEVLVSLQHHEIEVRNALIVIASHPLVEVLLFDDFTYVLVDECLCRDATASS